MTTDRLPITEWLCYDQQGYVIGTVPSQADADAALNAGTAASTAPVANLIRPEEIDFYNGRRLIGEPYADVWARIKFRRNTTLANA